MKMQEERIEIVRVCRELLHKRLTNGTSGNVSVCDRELGLVAITPSGCEYDTMEAEDLIVMDLDGNIIEGTKKPTTETGLHLAFYKARPDISAVVHTHPMYSSIFACLGEPILPIVYTIGITGAKEVKCAPYYTFGTPELANTTVEVCGKDNAILMANHGLTTVADSLKKAYVFTADVEFVAELLYRTRTIGTPNILTDGQMDEFLGRLTEYGQR